MRISDWSSACALPILLKEQGACFGEKLGWERPNWYADAGRGEVAQDRYRFGRPNWFEAVGRAHRAAREAAVVFDQSSFAKFLLARKSVVWGKGVSVRVDPGCDRITKKKQNKEK